MELPYNVYPTLLNQVPITILDQLYIQQYIQINKQKQNQLKQCIDSIGLLSSKAQQLNNIITTYDKFISSIDKQTILLCTSVDNNNIQSNNTVYGYIKIGYKNLFYYNNNGHIIELNNQLCVLDFYVYHTYQRNGIGLLLFNTMLQHCNKQAYELAYDRPSHKFLSFLHKHYNLYSYIQQQNNYVIFDQYFTRSNHNRQQQHTSTTHTNDYNNKQQQQQHTQHTLKQTKDALDTLINTQRNSISQTIQQHTNSFSNRNLHSASLSRNNNNQFTHTAKQVNNHTSENALSDLTNTKQYNNLLNDTQSKHNKLQHIQQQINDLQHTLKDQRKNSFSYNHKHVSINNNPIHHSAIHRLW